MSLHAFLSQLGFDFIAQPLVDPKSGALMDAWQELVASALPEDLVVFGFFGHGHTVGDDQLLLASNSSTRLLPTKQNAVSFRAMKLVSDACGAERVFLLDCCRDNFYTKAQSDRRIGGRELFQGKAVLRDISTSRDVQAGFRPSVHQSGPVTTVFGCQDGQVALEIPALEKGLLTTALIEVGQRRARAGRSIVIDDAFMTECGGVVVELAQVHGLPEVPRPDRHSTAGHCPELSDGVRHAEGTRERPRAATPEPPPRPTASPFEPYSVPAGSKASIEGDLQSARRGPASSDSDVRFSPAAGSRRPGTVIGMPTRPEISGVPAAQELSAAAVAISGTADELQRVWNAWFVGSWVLLGVVWVMVMIVGGMAAYDHESRLQQERGGLSAWWHSNDAKGAAGPYIGGGCFGILLLAAPAAGLAKIAVAVAAARKRSLAALRVRETSEAFRLSELKAEEAARSEAVRQACGGVIAKLGEVSRLVRTSVMEAENRSRANSLVLAMRQVDMIAQGVASDLNMRAAIQSSTVRDFAKETYRDLVNAGFQDERVARDLALLFGFSAPNVAGVRTDGGDQGANPTRGEQRQG